MIDIDAIVVDPILEIELPIRQFRDRSAREPLRIVDHFDHVGIHVLCTEALDQLQELSLCDRAGGQLCAKVAEDLNRNSNVLLDHQPQSLVEFSLVVQLHRRDAQAFLVDFRRIRRVRPRDPPADIRVMTNGGRESDSLSLPEDWLEDKDIRQVHTAVERIVHDIHVFRLDRVAESADDDIERRRDRTEVAWKGQALSNQFAVCIRESGREIHIIAQDSRVGRAADGERHFVRD